MIPATRLLPVLAMAVLLGSGCGELPVAEFPSASASVLHPSTDAHEAAPMTSTARQMARPGSDYKLTPADLVSFSLYGSPDMNRKARVGANGIVTLPLVGSVKVGGLTLGAAQARIEAKMAVYVVQPQVTLFIEEYGNRTFSVMGEVQKPGSYTIPTESRMTLLEAISTAGGFTPVAAQDRARVLRQVNGVSKTITVDIRAITHKREKDKDLVIEPNDVVFVPQSLF